MKNLNHTLIIVFFLMTAPLYRGVCQEKKVALVSFNINKKIDTKELGLLAKKSAKLLSSITNLVDDPDFDLKPILEKFQAQFFSEFAPNFPFFLLPAKEVIGNPEYVNYNVNENDESEPIEGHKVINALTIGKSGDAQKMLEIFKNKANGVMIVDIYFSFRKTTIVSSKVVCTFSMRLWNTQGKQKQVFWILEDGSSEGIIPSPGGIPLAKTEKMLELCTEASDKLLVDLAKKGKMKKIVKKGSKKLK